MNLQPRPCMQCGVNIAESCRKRCFTCLYPDRPLPHCKTCGSDAHYAGGYCRPCHPRLLYADSCSDCFAWGTWRRHGRCAACTSFRNRGHETGACETCRRTVPLKRGVCRLCRCQAASMPRTWQRPDLATAAATGHQLFLADMVRRIHLTANRRQPAADPAVLHSITALGAPTPRWTQEPLVTAKRDMSRVVVRDVQPIDPAFTRYVALQPTPWPTPGGGPLTCASTYS